MSMMSEKVVLDINTIIPEEAYVAATDAESANKTESIMRIENVKERGDRQMVADYFRFITIVEETKTMDKQRSVKPSFIKNYKDDEKDWTENHFFCLDGEKGDDCKVVFTSYQVKKVIENGSRAGLNPVELIDVNKKPEKNTDFYYMKAEKPCKVVPIPNIPKEGKVHEYIEWLKKQNPDEFDDNCRLEDLYDSLSEEELKDTLKATTEEIRDAVNRFGKIYRTGLVHQDLMTMLKALFHWQGGALDETMYELILGLGHVRMIYSKKKNSDDRKILNAPLIEVPVDVDKESLKVVPVPGARLKWNGEAKAALLFTEEGKHKRILDDFQTLVADGDPLDIVLGDPKTFRKYVEKASKFSWLSQIMKPTDDSLHQVPDELKIPVFTTEWCLFVRPKRSNIISDDARAIANFIEKKMLDLSLPCRSLVLGMADSDYEEGEPFREHLPLPASQNQLEIIQNVYSSNNGLVSLIQGAPGTGKTQTGVNIASVALQRGGYCLVTSDNSRALEAFEQKLPSNLSCFCVNLSTMQEDGIGKLSQTFDRMEFDLLALRKNKDRYANDIERIQKAIDSVKKQHEEKAKDLKNNSKISRELIKKLEFSKLVKHGLRGNAEICPYITKILKHEDLGRLKQDLGNLFRDQGAEADEPIPFKYDESEYVTRDMIEFAEKQERLAGSHHTGKRCLRSDASNYSIDGKTPKTADDWARVKRGLRVKKSEREFEKAHAKPLIERGCPEALIFENGMVRQRFVRAVNALHESLEGVKPDDFATLMRFLEDVSINRNLQKMQRDFTVQIRELDEELVCATIAQKLSASISSSDLGKFSQLKELASRMKDNEVDAIKASFATMHRKSKLKELIQKSLGCFPLLLMTTEQVSRYIPVHHCFDLVVVDEATQSPSNRALTILARAKQAVIIGDTRQSLPKDDLSEEAKSAISKSKGSLDLADLFIPGNGNNLLDACLHHFAVNLDKFRSHFRCPSEGVSWSNKKMYGGKMELYKPSSNNVTLSLEITGSPEEKMTQHVHEIVRKALTSDSISQDILTIGVILMGSSKNEVSAFTAALNEKLRPFLNQYGSDAIGRHLIKVATPEGFQGQERDIILIGCLANKISLETDPHSLRRWNVATTRHKRMSTIFSRYDVNDMKEIDHRHAIYGEYKRAQSRVCVGGFNEGKSDIRSMAEDRLFEKLQSLGYVTCRNKATIWENALSIGLQEGSINDNSALLAIENYGESDDDWRKLVDQQTDLEEARIACLRVDAMALSLCSKAVFDDIELFLRETAGLSPRNSEGSRKSVASQISNGNQPASSEQRKRPASNISTRKNPALRGKKHRF